MRANYDLHLAVHALVPNAKYSNAYNYAMLKKTWADTRALPTERELKKALANWVDTPSPDRDSAVVKLKATVGLTDREIAAIGFVE